VAHSRLVAAVFQHERAGVEPDGIGRVTIDRFKGIETGTMRQWVVPKKLQRRVEVSSDKKRSYHTAAASASPVDVPQTVLAELESHAVRHPADQVAQVVPGEVTARKTVIPRGLQPKLHLKTVVFQ